MLSRSFRVFLLCLGLNIAVPRMVSQALSASADTDAPDFVMFKQVREVSFALTITDKRGRFVDNLTPSDLVILDNDDRPDQITYFKTQSSLPLQIALVIDTSDSVTCCLRSERNAAIRFLKHNLRNAHDHVMIITFNHEVDVRQPVTADLSLLQRSLNGLRADGDTAIYDAVSVASQELGKSNSNSSQPSRRVIILITDGEDNRSRIYAAAGSRDRIAKRDRHLRNQHERSARESCRR